MFRSIELKRRIHKYLFPYFFGRKSATYYRFLQRSQWWERHRIEQWQLERLKLIIKHAYDYFPLYGNKMRAEGIYPEDICSLADMRFLPIITKIDLLSVPEEDRRATNTQGNTKLIKTGGTTGSPLRLHISSILGDIIEPAMVLRHQNWAGLQYGEKIAVMRGAVITEDPKAVAPMRLQGDNLYLSAWHISARNLALYYQALRDFKPSAIRAYPSALLTFTRFLRLKKMVPPTTVRVLITASETVTPEIRQEIESYWQVPISDYYGLGEYTAKLFQCEFRRYHFQEEFAYVELIPLNGDETSSRIIGTNLYNFATPLVRYDSGDYASPPLEFCKCGRSLRNLETVQGRPMGRIITKDRRVIRLMASTIVGDSPGIHISQLYQDTPTKIVIRIVKNERYSEADWNNLVRQFRVRVGEQTQIEREFVDDVELTPAGKRLDLVQKLDVDSFL